jgi:acyl carrier protein
MNLVLAIEDDFNVRFAEDEIADLTSLPALRAALARLTVDVPA